MFTSKHTTVILLLFLPSTARGTYLDELFFAITQRDVERVSQLLHNKDIHYKDVSSPFILALQLKNPDIIQQFLLIYDDKHPDFFIYEDKKIQEHFKELAQCPLRVIYLDGTIHKTTFLHIAAKKNYGALAQRLLQTGASVNSSDDEHLTPLMIASQSSRELVQLFLLHGANFNQKVPINPLAEAAKQKNYSILHDLLIRGDQDDKGEALNECLKNNDIDGIYLLLSYKSAVNVALIKKTLQNMILHPFNVGPIIESLLCFGLDYKPVYSSLCTNEITTAAARGDKDKILTILAFIKENNSRENMEIKYLLTKAFCIALGQRKKNILKVLLPHVAVTQPIAHFKVQQSFIEITPLLLAHVLSHRDDNNWFKRRIYKNLTKLVCSSLLAPINPFSL